MRPEPLRLPPPPFEPLPSGPYWPLSRVLMRFGETKYRIRQAVSGTIVFGGNDSGKTSGSGHAISKSFLLADFGILFNCTKRSDRSMYEKWARDCGRGGQLCIIELGGPHRLNFIEYLTQVSDIQNAIQIFETIAETAMRARGGQQNDAFWQSNRWQLICNILRPLHASRRPFTLDDMRTFLQEALAESWRSTRVFGPRLMEAIANTAGTRDEQTMTSVRDFWLVEYRAQPEKTRVCCQMSLLPLFEIFNDATMRELFASDTTLCPEHLDSGAVVICDLSVKEYPGMGLVAQQIWRVLTQQTIERRQNTHSDTCRPIAIVTDEAQHTYIHPIDNLYQATSRSCRGATCAILQNLANIMSQVTGTNGEQAIYGWIGTFQTMILHNQSEPMTAKFYAEILGKSRKFRVSGSDGGQSLLGRLFGGPGHSSGLSLSSEEVCNEPMDCYRGLRTGGPENDHLVDAFLVMNTQQGRTSKRFYLPVVFRQDVEPAVRPVKKSVPWFRRFFSFLSFRPHHS